MAAWGSIIVAGYILMAVISTALDGFGLLSSANDGLNNPIYSAPSIEHWCGTDRLGRDVCNRTLLGSAVALKVVFFGVTFAVLIGVPLGILSGYLGGLFDRILVLFMDTLYTIPVLLLSVVIAFLLGRGIFNAAIALCVVYIPQYFRVVRNQTAQVKSELFIDAAKTSGAGPLWVIRKYLFTNVMALVCPTRFQIGEMT